MTILLFCSNFNHQHSAINRASAIVRLIHCSAVLTVAPLFTKLLEQTLPAIMIGKRDQMEFIYGVMFPVGLNKQ